jgi:hypothetical protein
MNRRRRMKISKITIILLILSVFVFIGCGSKAENAGEKLNYDVKDSKGVKVYANSKEPSVDKIEMNVVELFTINGDVEDELQSFVIQQPAFDIDKEGNIYLVDIKSSSLK